jgi:glutathione S-transferase
MRSWITLKILEIDFEEILITFYQNGSEEKILKVSPSGKFPCLHHDNNVI